MSVDTPRLAAAQRTAARTTGSPRRRWTRLASWILIVPTLSLFSFSVVAGATTKGKPDYAATAKELGTAKPLVALTTNGKKELCSISASQLARLGSLYTVGHMSVDVDGKAVDVVTLSGKGANDRDLRVALGTSAVTCKLVRIGGVFFLPFDAHTS